MVKQSMFALILAGMVALPNESSASSARAFVASYGLDANTSQNCGPTAPCRTFGVALSVTNPGGEVVVLNSAGYGPVSIAQSVTITAPTGVYAGITVASGTGISISGSGVAVALRGLTINGAGGGAMGVAMKSGASLLVENCSFTGFSASAGAAIYVQGPIQARITDTTVRDGLMGIQIVNGPNAVLDHVKVFNMSSAGVQVYADAAGTTVVTATDTLVTGSQYGLQAYSEASGAVARITVARSTVSESSVAGVWGYAKSGGVSRIELSDSLISGNSNGIEPSGDGVSVMLSGDTITESPNCGVDIIGPAIVQTYGNNSMSNNATDFCGSHSTAPLQ